MGSVCVFVLAIGEPVIGRLGRELCERQVCVRWCVCGRTGLTMAGQLGIDMEVGEASVRCVPSECAKGVCAASVGVSEGVFFT